MHDAPQYDPLEASTFFTDGRSARTPVVNTVARGMLREDEHFYQGTINGQLTDTFPMPVTAEMMARGASASTRSARHVTVAQARATA